MILQAIDNAQGNEVAQAEKNHASNEEQKFKKELQELFKSVEVVRSECENTGLNFIINVTPDLKIRVAYDNNQIFIFNNDINYNRRRLKAIAAKIEQILMCYNFTDTYISINSYVKPVVDYDRKKFISINDLVKNFKLDENFCQRFLGYGIDNSKKVKKSGTTLYPLKHKLVQKLIKFGRNGYATANEAKRRLNIGIEELKKFTKVSVPNHHYPSKRLVDIYY